MREKAPRCIVSFSTNAHAMALSAACEKRGIAGRLIPLPVSLKASCGLAWCALCEDEGRIRALIDEEGLNVESIDAAELYVRPE